MREFKFRAWDKEHKELISWRDICSYYNLLSMLDPVARDYERYEVMQYIGLKDKNGVEIYEGDILANTMNDRLVVVRYGKYMDVFGDTWYGFYYEGTNYNYKISADTSGICVIDNIYENQNLVKELKINE